MSNFYVDNPLKQNKKSDRLYKKCPKCNGSGKNIPMMSGMVMIPGINDMTPKKKPGLFICDKCNGSGKLLHLLNL